VSEFKVDDRVRIKPDVMTFGGEVGTVLSTGGLAGEQCVEVRPDLSELRSPGGKGGGYGFRPEELEHLDPVAWLAELGR